ncbi:hypothetical protein A3860_36345 [Niastella vici]|uniref:Uncharacterized protein n=1 Tax=Niastella vici TaxID=1703345 RepID=A0A1V9FN39_9BACT|nr:hypothetical protein [Niastella vici]OQP59752.1 hypothetical protein A3860_36345 [Niastella vici]
MNEKRYDQFFMSCMVVFTILMLCARIIKHRQLFLNHYIPFGIYLLGTVVGMVALYWVRRKLFKIRETVKIYMTDFVIIVKNIFLSGVVFGSLAYWIFTFFNYKAAEKAAVQFQKIEIDKISIKSSGTHNSIYFKFMGTQQAINNFVSTDIIRLAAKSENYGNYFLNLKFRKGLLTSYVIDHWSVESILHR